MPSVDNPRLKLVFRCIEESEWAILMPNWRYKQILLDITPDPHSHKNRAYTTCVRL